MAEYAIDITGKEIWIGSCEVMYNLRYEDRFKVQQADYSLDTHNTLNLFWRLPYPDEDHIPAGKYKDSHRGEMLWQKDGTYNRWFQCPELAKQSGSLQLVHPSGLLMSVPCYHGERLPELGEGKAFWNGKSYSYELAHIKNTKEGIVPVVRCRHCEKLWSFEWADVLPYLHDELKKRLEVYDAR